MMGWVRFLPGIGDLERLLGLLDHPYQRLDILVRATGLPFLWLP
jgi:hypothetical protein